MALPQANRLKKLSWIRGDSSPAFEVRIPDVPVIDADWTCKMVLVSAMETGVYLIQKDLPLNGDASAFVGKIIPSESVTLSEKEYFLIFEVNNIVQEFRRELQYFIEIIDSGYINA
jgi:hypothetical protein